MLLTVAGCAPDPREPFAYLPEQFRVERIAAIFNVDDAGVGDVDGDGRLDLWTTNHSAQQWIALAASDGSFAPNALSDLGLHQDLRVPGIEPTLARPACGPFRQIYLRGNTLIIESGGTAHKTPLSGEIRLPWPTQLAAAGNGSWERLACTDPSACTRARFRLGDGGQLRLETIPPRSDGFPIQLVLDATADLAEVRIGSACIRPPAAAIGFELKDRHGLLLADLAGDGAADLFVSRGGARGRLNKVNPHAADELWVGGKRGYQPAIAGSGIVKAGCPGRQVGAFDVDNDGDLDIYQVCGRSGGASAASRNRLYLQRQRGAFEEAAGTWGLDLEGAGTFAWVASSGSRPEPLLLWATADAVRVLARRGAGFETVWQRSRTGGEADAVLLAPPAADGSIAVAIVGPGGNSMLMIEPTGYRLVSFATLGLPVRSSGGNWVDLDGDGRTELFLVPQGLFAANDRFKWRGTGAFALRHKGLAAVQSSWFDADADGDLDLWLLRKDGRLAWRPLRWPATRLSPRLSRWYTDAVERMVGPVSWEPHMWEALLVRNQAHAPTHLPVRVRGLPGNREAVGALVELTAGDMSRSAVVAASGNARLSQTLYEVYLGISELAGPGEVQVSLPGVPPRRLAVDLHGSATAADRADRQPAAGDGVSAQIPLQIELTPRDLAEGQP